MYAALLMAGMVQVVQDGPGISVADADRFRQASEVANAQLTLARSHREGVRAAIWFANDSKTFGLWADETAWRIACWEKLSQAFNPESVRLKAWYSYPESREPFEGERLRERLKMLGELRTLLGSEDFYAGRMPAPTPRYKP